MTSFSMLKLISEITQAHDIKNVSDKDAGELMRHLTQRIKELDTARRGFMGDKIIVDPRGRVTLPAHFRTLLDMGPDTRLEVFPYPSHAPKGLMLKKV